MAGNYSVFFTAEGQQDVDRLLCYYDAEKAFTGKRFHTRLSKAITQLNTSQQPNRWQRRF